MSAIPRSRPKVKCENCGNVRLSVRKSRSICSSCYEKEPKTRCQRCNRSKRGVSFDTQLCPACESRVSLQGKCSRCSKNDILKDLEAKLCLTCWQAKYQKKRKEKLHTYEETECSRCGKVKKLAFVSRKICYSCQAIENNGIKICSECGKEKVITLKSKCLCKQCAKNYYAPGSLKKYLNAYHTDYLFNAELFEIIVGKIRWEEVTEKYNQKIRAFGNFLQENEMHEPLTWEEIYSKLPHVGKRNREKPLYIRDCLFQVGQILVDKNQLESREDFLDRRSVLRYLELVPQDKRDILQKYTEWLVARRQTFNNIRHHLEAFNLFWSWALNHGINDFTEVQPLMIRDYIASLKYIWRCSRCSATFQNEDLVFTNIGQCSACGGTGSLSKEDRYSHNAILGFRSKLKVFFDWLKLKHLVLMNPVIGKMRKIPETIECYSIDNIQNLCKYIIDPTADPTEALVLYLVLLHACSIWEIQYARVPMVYSLGNNEPEIQLSSSYYLILPEREPTIGKHAIGRHSRILNFSDAASIWLVPLLERFVAQRKLFTKNSKNDFLIVTSESGRFQRPAHKTTITNYIKRASIKVLGGACNANALRKTAGIIYANKAGGSILENMGWSPLQAFKYSYLPRKNISPRLENKVQLLNRSSNDL